MMVIAALFCVLGVLSSSVWTALGQSLRRLLTDARSVRIFNGIMALALVASLWPVLKDLFP
jgi:threonine/homoserine/homoserine lactone efflux protein